MHISRLIMVDIMSLTMLDREREGEREREKQKYIRAGHYEQLQTKNSRATSNQK
jgi:hypothetical protein